MGGIAISLLEIENLFPIVEGIHCQAVNNRSGKGNLMQQWDSEAFGKCDIRHWNSNTGILVTSATVLFNREWVWKIKTGFDEKVTGQGRVWKDLPCQTHKITQAVSSANAKLELKYSVHSNFCCQQNPSVADGCRGGGAEGMSKGPRPYQGVPPVDQLGNGESH